MRSLVLFFLLMSLWAAAQPCQYLAYDGFDYADQLPLNGRNGGSGWQDPWSVQNEDEQLPGYQVAGAGSLVFGDLQTLGRSSAGGRAYLTAGRRLDARDGGPFDVYVAEFNEGIGSQSSGVLWVSALLRKDQNNDQSVYTGLHASSLPWCDACTTDKIAVGYFGSPSDEAGQKRWTLRLGDAFYRSSVAVVPGETALLVLRLEFGVQSTQVSFYVNPAELGEASPVPALSQSTASPLVLRSLMAYLGNAPGNGALDEIRLASSYACVAPDETVLIDLPPVAVVSAPTNTGTAPLELSLSGAASYDPEGGPLTYTWQLGDGSPIQTSNVVTHTYTDLGNLTARLTVTDAGGQSHTALYSLLVRSAEGTFPCLSSFSLVQTANCSGTGGLIRINDHPADFSLQNEAGVVLSPVNGREYPQLPAGTYTYRATSPEGCRDEFRLHVPIDSTTCPDWEPALCNLNIGTNLSGFADWVPERPLRNLMKHVRDGFIAYHDDCFCWDNGHTAEIAADADGYPTAIPQSIDGQPNKVRYVISTEGANLPPGQTYVLLYDGQGSIGLQGAVSVSASTPGRIQFEVVSTDIVYFNLEASQAGNHLRNIRVLRLEDEHANLDEDPFYPGFLDKIAPFKTLRFMDWGHTNGNPAQQWSDRSSLSYYTYAVPQGVPYEMMIKLANQLQKDVWLCVPHAADSQYVARMAALFRDQLDPNLTIYLEYSNEVWNWIFAQAHYNVQNAPSNLNYGRAMAAKAGRTFGIWHEVFGTAHGRVKRVLGLQAGFNYLNEQILAHLSPDDWDYGSPTSYLGLVHGASGNPVLQEGSTVQDVINNARQAWYGFIPDLRQDYRNVRLFGKGIINYEGGQHFVGNVFGIPYPYQQAMWDAQYSPQIYTLYDEMLDSLRRWGVELFANFSLAGPQESVYGSWGVLNDIDIQPPYLPNAPKYQALLDNICEETPVSTHPQPDSDGVLTQLNLFPNPSGGLLWLSFHPPLAAAPNSPPMHLAVYDALGRQVWARQQPSLPIDLSHLPPGIYHIVVSQANTQWSKTWLKG